MKYLAYTLLAFLSFILFFPRTGNSEVRNLPLLIVTLAILAAYLTYRCVRRVILISNVKQTLCESGYVIQPSFPFPFLGGVLKAQRKGTALNITLLTNIKKSLHYHFDGTGKLETYVGTRMAVVGRSGGFMSKKVEMTSRGRRRLPWKVQSGEEYVILMDKMPSRVSDTANAELFSGDMIEGKVMLLCADDITMLKKI